MVDIKSFTLSLPSFVERSYFISPGIVSVIFKVIWSIFTFLIITFVIQYGLAAVGIRSSQTNNKKKSLLNVHHEYTQVQGVTNGRWGDMITNLPSIRVILGFLFWIFIYAFELLFSLSIDNAYITRYNGTNCIGRVDDYIMMANSTWDPNLRFAGSNVIVSNSTFLRQLLNQKQVGNFALLGDGIVAISPGNAMYTKGQTINVSKAGMNCTPAVQLQRTDAGMVFKYDANGGMVVANISTEHFSNISLPALSSVEYAYINLDIQKKSSYNASDPNLKVEIFYLITISNPLGLRQEDINLKVFNNSVFINDCTLAYEQGYVTVDRDGYLNETNIADSFTPVFNETLYNEFTNTSLTNIYSYTDSLLNIYEYPDEFLNGKYNNTYLDTLKIINNIVAAHFVNGLDPSADPCTFNQEQVPVYVSVIGTRMSFGYIIVGVSFAVAILAVLAAFAFTLFTPEERNRWILYSRDWCYTGYVATGDQMDKKSFKEYAKEIRPGGDNASSTSSDQSEKTKNSDLLLKENK